MTSIKLPAVKAALAAACLLLAPAAQAQHAPKPQAPAAKKPPQPKPPQLSPQQISCLNRDQKFTLEQQIEGCSAIIKANKDIPHNMATAFYRRGIAHIRKGEIDRGIEDFTQTIRRNPQHVPAFNDRGNAFGRKGQFNRAIEDHDQAVRIAPKSPLGYTNRAADYKAKGQYDRALKDYHQAIKLAPNFAVALYGRCATRAMLGRELREALADCDAALRLDQDNALRAGILENRGLVYARLDEFYSAVTDYNAALDLEPRSPTALYGRGYVKRKKGDFSGEADIANAKALKADIADDFARFGLK